MTTVDLCADDFSPFLKLCSFKNSAQPVKIPGGFKTFCAASKNTGWIQNILRSQ